jgi:hypothetical protein
VLPHKQPTRHSLSPTLDDYLLDVRDGLDDGRPAFRTASGARLAAAIVPPLDVTVPTLDAIVPTLAATAPGIP